MLANIAVDGEMSKSSEDCENYSSDHPRCGSMADDSAYRMVLKEPAAISGTCIAPASVH
jgi:hypothetical protein